MWIVWNFFCRDERVASRNRDTTWEREAVKWVKWDK